VTKIEGNRKRTKSGGRKKGTPNKTTAQLKDMILTALGNVGGIGYLEKQASQNPTAFLTLVGKVLPLTHAGDPDAPVYHKIVREFVSAPNPNG
jgi:hypothetical protein